MKVIHLLCPDGITAELWLGALIHAGASAEAMQEPIDRAGVAARILVETGDAREVAATFVRIESDPDADRIDTVAELKQRIADAELPARADGYARAVADALIGAEAAAHAVPLEAVRFHELGRPRGVARILAGAVALDELGIERVTTGPVALGSGTIEIAHGHFPVPPPAVQHLLRGFRVHGDSRQLELTTPSGAAILAGLAQPVDTIPSMRLEGYGRGATGAAHDQRLLTILVGSA